MKEISIQTVQRFVEATSADEHIGPIPVEHHPILGAVASALHAHIAEGFLKKYAPLFDVIESPIEAMLIGALMARIVPHTEFVHVPDGENAPDMTGIFAVYVTPQAKVEKYRADFLINFRCARTCGDVVNVSLYVECDGREFHDKTAEQADRDRQRDRAFQRLGLPLMRFSGSEIWRDPYKCAGEVLGYLLNGANARKVGT